jgi:hypothetical protein
MPWEVSRYLHFQELLDVVTRWGGTEVELPSLCHPAKLRLLPSATLHPELLKLSGFQGRSAS